MIHWTPLFFGLSHRSPNSIALVAGRVRITPVHVCT